MAVKVGSATKLNTIKGFSSILAVSDADFATYGASVYPANMLIRRDNGTVLITDGTTALSALSPTIDQVLTVAEKNALSAALGTGSYVAAANGVVVHGADGKIDDGSLKVVSNGQITASYLTDFIVDGVILESALPDIAKVKVTFLATYADLANATAIQKMGLVVVLDATGDDSVDEGGARYAWDAEGSEWVKLGETESMDLDIEALTPSYENVEAAGAVMYEHDIMVEAGTISELDGYINAAD